MGEGKAEKSFGLALIFTGHMIDLPDRQPPRFPPEMETLVSAAIRRRVLSARRSSAGPLLGIASAARGGDILFLEACRSLSLEIRILLPFAKARFLQSSVGQVGDVNWNARFGALWLAVPRPHRQVLRPPASQNPYEYCNIKMLALARKLARNTRLISLWEGLDKQLKPGGTASFIARARAAGGTFVHIDSQKLLRELPIRSTDRG